MSTGSSSWIRKERRLAIYIRDEFTCCYCGKSLKGSDPRQVTLDHLVPRSAGGNNRNDNLVTACLSCNSARQDKPWVDYATGGAKDRILTRVSQEVNVVLAKALIAGEAGDPAVEAER